MEQKLFTEIAPLYTTSKEKAVIIRIRIRMRDLIDSEILRRAVDMTMQRYPYFCVRLQKKGNGYVFEENHRPIVITNSLHGVTLNSEESNYHMVAFCIHDNWIGLDIFHGLTDGAGAYEVVRTLLYYYCSERYNIKLNGEGIHLLGDEISPEEWEDPTAKITGSPIPEQNVQESPSLNLIASAGLEGDRRDTVYSIAISEAEFMKFNLENDGSPATMVALLFSRAIAKMYPETEDAIRVALCVNLRKVLQTPLAHHCLVGDITLEYKTKMRDWPMDMQATAYRGMVHAQTREEQILMGVSFLKEISRMVLSKETDRERAELAYYITNMKSRTVTASVSYVGKANYREAEKYIRDFRLWTPPMGEGLLIEISAVNGRFTLDFLQTFSSPVFVNAFLNELEENGIVYDLQDVNELEIPTIQLPWIN